MANIVDYVIVNGDENFEQRPFQKEDALVLCEFSYLKFDTLIEPMQEKMVSIKEMEKSKDYESLFADYRYEKDNRALFEAMVNSKRFGEIKTCFYINHIDLKDETQFCAITVILPTGVPFVAFRGTDEYMVGWQEDFRLALTNPIPGQKLSAKYVNDVAQRVNGDFMIGGHSKGGNLALYSAMNCAETVKSRISAIYSFDGPGFRPEFLEEYGFDIIKDRVISVIPKSSVVGMMLSVDENSIVVNSKSVSVLQHNPYNWIIKDGLLTETTLSEGHVRLVDTFNDWMYSLNEEQLDEWIELLVDILKATKADTTLEVSADTYKYVMNVIKAAQNVDDSTKEFLSNCVKSFMELWKEKLMEEAYSKIGEVTAFFEEKKCAATKKIEEVTKKKDKK